MKEKEGRNKRLGGSWKALILLDIINEEIIEKDMM